jgi:hypothetical protein
MVLPATVKVFPKMMGNAETGGINIILNTAHLKRCHQRHIVLPGDESAFSFIE